MAILSRQIAGPGTTGNNTHAFSEDYDADRFGVQFVIEAVGATPTVTFILEGSFDGTNWVACGYVTDSSSAEAFAALTKTATGSTFIFLTGPHRFYRRYRVRVTANTNVTYNCTLCWQERPE